MASWTDYQSVRACLLLYSRRFKRISWFNRVNTDRQDLPARLHRDRTGKNFTYCACLRTCWRSHRILIKTKTTKVFQSFINQTSRGSIWTRFFCFVNSPTQHFLFFFDVLQFGSKLESIQWTQQQQIMTTYFLCEHVQFNLYLPKWSTLKFSLQSQFFALAEKVRRRVAIINLEMLSWCTVKFSEPYLIEVYVSG